MTNIFTSTPGIEYLIMGACHKGNIGNFQKCAWEPNECASDSFFVAMETNPRIMSNCNPSEQPVGRCMLEDQCAIRASDCASDGSNMNFKVDDPTCTIQRDTAFDFDPGNPEFTQFGSCKNTLTGEHFCVYNPTDCDDSQTEVYVGPSETKAAGVVCDCSKVHVTRCEVGGNNHCAINEQGCRANSIAYSPHDQRVDRVENINNIDCRLCEAVATNSPTSGPTYTTPTNSPTRVPTEVPTNAPRIPTEVPTSSGCKTVRNFSAWTLGCIASAGILIALQ